MWIKMEDLQKKLKPYIAMLAGIFSDILLILSLLTAGSSLFILINEHRTGEPCFVLGYKTVMVSSGSMEDTFSKGDLVLIEEINGKEAVPGDILLFRKGESLVLHRYIGNDSERLSSDSFSLQNGVFMFMRLLVRAPFLTIGSIVMSFVLNVYAGIAVLSALLVCARTVALVRAKTPKGYVAVQSG